MKNWTLMFENLNNICDDLKMSIPGVGAKGLAEALAQFILFIVLIFSFTSYVKAEEGPVCWWKFDEGSGSVLHDSGEYGSDGEIHGATWVKCKTGFALFFDGKDDEVNCGTSFTIPLKGPLTISTWINIPDTPTKEKSNILYVDPEIDIEWYVIGTHEWNIAIDSSLVPIFETWSVSGIPRIYLSANRKIPMNKWVYLVVIYSVKREVMEFYINGEMVNSKKRTGAILDRHIFPLCFGKDPLVLINFKGFIGETKVYNRALSSEEVKNNYQMELGR